VDCNIFPEAGSGKSVKSHLGVMFHGGTDKLQIRCINKCCFYVHAISDFAKIAICSWKCNRICIRKPTFDQLPSISE